jgi:hypothetical protein
VAFKRDYDIMRQITLTAFLGLVFQLTFGQNFDSLGMDCNPRLNEQEISYFDSLFSQKDYNFRNKTIGFASPNVIHFFGIIPIPPGFNNQLLPISKKEYFQELRIDDKNKKCSELLILTDSLKAITKGFDAIIILIPKKKLKKVNSGTTQKIATVFGYRDLNYPDNLDSVGADTSLTLNNEEVKFLNQIYQHDKNEFDFSNKSIVIVDYYSKNIVKKQDYINRIKNRLKKDFLYQTDDLIVLSEQEKQETGYDVIILLPVKMIQREELIEIIKTPHNN